MYRLKQMLRISIFTLLLSALAVATIAKAETGNATESPELLLACDLSLAANDQKRIVLWQELLEANQMLNNKNYGEGVRQQVEPVLQRVEARLKVQAYDRSPLKKEARVLSLLQVAALWLILARENNFNLGPGDYELEHLLILDIAGYPLKDLVALSR